MVHVVLPIMIASVIPFALALAAKAGTFSKRDNHRQREWQASLEGWRKRAYWAQANALETLPMFMAGAICAHLGNPGHAVAVAAAWAYPATRLAFTACYLADKAQLRSLSWYFSMAAIVTLFVVALTG